VLVADLRDRRTGHRRTVNAILWILRTGAHWVIGRMVPALGRWPPTPSAEDPAAHPAAAARHARIRSGYPCRAAHSFRERVWAMGARLAIPTKSNEEPVACPDWVYVNRNLVERLWNRLKEWRAVATRYEKTARSFMGVLCLAAAFDWIKTYQDLAAQRELRIRLQKSRR
jgi:transposase